MKVKSRTNLQGPLAFRDALKIGRFPGPCCVIPSNRKDTLYIIEEPSHLLHADTAYNRFKLVANSCKNRAPDCEFTLIQNCDNHFESATDVRTILDPVRNERLRLADDRINCRPKTYIMRSLAQLAIRLLERLEKLEPNAPELLEPRPSTHVGSAATTADRNPQSTAQQQRHNLPDPIREGEVDATGPDIAHMETTPDTNPGPGHPPDTDNAHGDSAQ